MLEFTTIYDNAGLLTLRIYLSASEAFGGIEHVGTVAVFDSGNTIIAIESRQVFSVEQLEQLSAKIRLEQSKMFNRKV